MAERSRDLLIRDVPLDVHEAIRARAQAAGQSMAAYVRSEIVGIARRPTLAEWHGTVGKHADGSAATHEDVVDALAELRE